MSGFYSAGLFDVIPDSVAYQWQWQDFADPWPANISDVNMTVSGLSQPNDLVTGDGIDDFGLADGPQDIPENGEFGIAFTIEYNDDDISDFERYLGCTDNGDEFQLASNGNGPPGNIGIGLRDGSNRIRVYTDSTFGNEQTRAVVINKRGNDAADFEIFVDDMENEENTSISDDEDFDHNNYSNDADIGFYCRNNDDTPSDHTEIDCGVFEFNNGPYSESERKDFISRRPEVS